VLLPVEPPEVPVVPLLEVPDDVSLVVPDVLIATCAQAEFDGADVPALL
jgi:hypothetical protein